MEVLAGVLIGILFTVFLLDKPITININHKHETVSQTFEMPDLYKELNSPDSKLDKVYSEDMKGLIDEVNSMMLGGTTNVKKEE